MESIFYVLLSELDAELKKQVKHFLSADKPVFVEEVAEPWQNLYLALEYISLPDCISSPSSETLLVGWETDLDHSGLNELIFPFHKADLVVDSMFFVPEGGDAIWVRSLDEECWQDERVLVAVRGDFSSDKRVARWMLHRHR